MTGLTPTDEQAEAVRLAMTGGHLAISALAGTGKTSGLVMIANEMKGKSGAYMAFNKVVADDAQGKFPRSVDSRTIHSFAHRAVGKNYRHRFDKPRLQSHKVASMLGVDGMMVKTPSGRKFLAAGFLAGMAERGLRQFCKSDDTEPRHWHIPTPRTMRDDKDLMAEWKEVRKHLEPALKKAWADIQDVNGVLRFDHSFYLKMWLLTEPVVPVDYLMIDELQDWNNAMLSLLPSQRKVSQIIGVGDAQQQIMCQPVGTSVRVPVPPSGRSGGIGYREVPIESLSEADMVVSYNVAQRVLHRGGSPLKSVRRFAYSGGLITVSTEDGDSSSYLPYHHAIVKINGAIPDKHVVYLMRRGTNFRIGRSPWHFNHRSNPKTNGLTARTQHEGADAAWVLSVHDDADAALLQEALTAHRFNIPTWTFFASDSHRIDLDAFWNGVGDLTPNADECLKAHGRMIEYPLIEKGRTFMSRRASVIAACNLMDGMQVLPMDNITRSDKSVGVAHSWVPIKVSYSHYDGDVISLEVEGDHTYVGDGIITHNSWNGSIEALSKIQVDNRCTLTNSFRFGPEIAAVANSVLDELGADMRLTGLGASGHVGTIDYPDLILSRTNAVAVRRGLEEFDKNGTPHIVGGAADVVSFAKGALSLQNGKSSWHPELACFDSWGEVRAYCHSDELGHDLKLLVELVDDFGAQRIVDSFDRMPPRSQASIVLSTAHKMKGAEAASVQLADDFPDESDGRTVDPEERRLLYVAVTRAKRELDISAVSLLRGKKPAALSLPALNAMNTSGFVTGDDR